jgi:branched-chain amino acid transport system permease protein
MSYTRTHRGGIAVLLAAIVVVAVTPLMLPDSTLSLLTVCGVYAIAAIGLNVLSGNAGQISLAMPFFMGVGAYLVAWAGVQHGYSLPVLLVGAVVVGGVLAALTGLVVVRMHGPELAIVTLGLLVFGTYLFTTWTSVTGGESGTSTTVPLTLGPLDLESIGSLTATQTLTWFVWAIVLICAVVTSTMLSWGHGRALRAIRASERSADAIGVDVRGYKLKATVFAGAAGALAGVLYAVAQGYVTAGEFDVDLAITLIAMIIIGGLGSVTGSIIGAIIVWGFQYVITEQAGTSLAWFLRTSPHDDGFISVGSFNTLVFGALIVVVLLLSPAGIAGAWNRRFSATTRRRPHPQPS